MKTTTDILERLGACASAVDALGDLSPETAWEECERGDWLLWAAAKLRAPRPTIVLAACECARLALRHVPEGEDRPRIAIETAEAWARGGAKAPSLSDMRTAAYAAAYSVAAAAYSVAAAAYSVAAAAYSADAAYAAYAAADAAYAAAYSAYAAADAAYSVAAAAAAAARSETLKTCADIVRRHIPFAVIKKHLEES